MGVNYIALACCDEEFRNEFAHFAAYFLIPGENGDNRKLLLESPIKWWEGWIGMLGNRIGQRQCYDTIAEMMALEELFKLDNSTKFGASPPSLTAKNPVVISEHHHPKMLKTL